MSALSRNGYIVDKKNLDQSCVEELTVTPKTFYSENLSNSFEAFVGLHNHTVAVPRYWAKERFGPAEVFDGRVDCTPRLVFNGELRSIIQKEAVRRSLDKLQNDGGGVLCLPTGTGKTVIALYIACAIKVKTLIVVHKQLLMDQWTERIKQFVPHARVGRLQQKNIDVEGCDIVVGMLQSIAMRQYEPEVFEGFGLVILDEVHVVPAPVFSRALFKVCSPCILGMSATPERKDGMSYVINWFVGPVLMEHQLTGKADVSVSVVQSKCYFKHIYGRAAMINVITRLCKNAERNSMIVRTINDLVADGRKVIVLSDRRNHCIELKNCLKNTSCMLYLGGMKEHELKESETKDVLLATYAMAKEGLDIPELDALVLAIPKSDVVQACGRILHGKSKNPIIVDIVDQWPIGKAQFNKRRTYYDRSGFTVTA